MNLVLPLPRLEDTESLALCLAQAIHQHGPTCLLLQGPLGSGKTTLTRILVQALPNGDQALVSSPSFNLVNVYPTRPEVAHIDLYRLEGMGVDEDILDMIQGSDMLVIVEWADHLDQGLRPGDHILGTLMHDTTAGRVISLEDLGTRAAAIIDMIRTCLPSEIQHRQAKEHIVR